MQDGELQPPSCNALVAATHAPPRSAAAAQAPNNCSMDLKDANITTQIGAAAALVQQPGSESAQAAGTNAMPGVGNSQQAQASAGSAQTKARSPGCGVAPSLARGGLGDDVVCVHPTKTPHFRGARPGNSAAFKACPRSAACGYTLLATHGSSAPAALGPGSYDVCSHSRFGAAVDPSQPPTFAVQPSRPATSQRIGAPPALGPGAYAGAQPPLHSPAADFARLSLRPGSAPVAGRVARGYVAPDIVLAERRAFFERLHAISDHGVSLAHGMADSEVDGSGCSVCSRSSAPADPAIAGKGHVDAQPDTSAGSCEDDAAECFIYDDEGSEREHDGPDTAARVSFGGSLHSGGGAAPGLQPPTRRARPWSAFPRRPQSAIPTAQTALGVCAPTAPGEALLVEHIAPATRQRPLSASALGASLCSGAL